MIVIFIQCLQYINTRKAALLYKSRLLASGNASTDAVKIEDPDTADGLIGTTYDPLLGYRFSRDGVELWAADIKGQYLCNGTGLWEFSTVLHYGYIRAFNTGGLFLLLTLTAVIAAAMTGVWPMIFSMSASLEEVLDREDDRRAEEIGSKAAIQEAVAIKDKRRRRGNFAKIWLIVSSGALVVFAGFTAHLICVVIGLPTVSSLERNGVCFFIDTTGLITPIGNSYTSSRAIAEEADTVLPRAQVAIKTDGSVDFVVNCEASMYQASTGATWTIVPEYGITCEDTPAYEILALNTYRQTKCTLGGWQPAAGPDSGFDLKEFPSESAGRKCGFLGMGKLNWRGWGMWKINRQSNWQKCQKSRQASYMTRTDSKTGDVQSVNFMAQLTVDPVAMGRQYGWYTSGDKEVIIHSTFNQGTGTSLVFKDVDWNDYMERIHFSRGAYDIIVNEPRALATQPNSLECKMLITVPNGADFVEFQLPCEKVWATQADEETAGIKIMTDNAVMCTVTVGYDSDNISTVISINTKNPVTLKGADRWRCTTLDTYGADCSPDHPFELFSPEIVNASIKTAVNRLGSDEIGNDGAELAIKPIKLFDLGEFSDILSILLITLACLAVVGVGVYVAVSYYRRRRLVQEVREMELYATDNS
jgi:hypothetical protein